MLRVMCGSGVFPGLLLAGLTIAYQPSAALAADLYAGASGKAMTVDGDASDWAGIDGITVPLAGEGGVARVELRAVVHGDSIFMIAQWDDATESRLHKPYKWNDITQSYRRTSQLEDRFAVSLAMSGDFSHSKLDGAEFTADVWHWKASRSDPAGVAHDKMWKVSRTEFPKSKKFETQDGRVVFLARISDAGDRLYRPMTYQERQEDVMPRYEVNLSPRGSIADVRAKGVWKDGRWTLEMVRKLDTGNADDAVIPAAGQIAIAVAAFNDTDGARHSTSGTIVLRTAGVGN